MANIFYNKIIRKIVVGFGDLFKNITLVRYNQDETEQERFVIPITYATKERYVMRLEEDPDLDKKVQITLPRFSFEMTSLSYDATRKLNTNFKSFAQSGSGLVSQYNPVPYNFDFALYLYTRNIEDAYQVVEHILSYFTPDYTIKLNLVPEMGIIKEIPIVLDKTDYEIEYEGPRENDTRVIIWTFNFTVKGFIFGKISDASNSLITHTITNIYQMTDSESVIEFTVNPTGFGNYKIGETVYQGYSYATSVATAKVYNWSNNKLYLKELSGNFTSTLPIIGSASSAKYNYTSYYPSSNVLSRIDVTVNPPTANVSSNWSANTVITEY